MKHIWLLFEGLHWRCRPNVGSTSLQMFQCLKWMWFLKLYMSIGLFFLYVIIFLCYHIHEFWKWTTLSKPHGFNQLKINWSLSNNTAFQLYRTLKENTMAGSLQTVLLTLYWNTSFGKSKVLTKLPL